MKNKLPSNFQHCRNDMIRNLFEVVGRSPYKSVMLSKNPSEPRIEDDGKVFQYHYKMLSIQNNELFVYYSSGEGVVPEEYESFVDDIVLFSLDEIYNITNHIKSF